MEQKKGRLKNGKFAKGNYGRPKGAVNKKTIIVKSFIDYILNGNISKFNQEFNKLEGKDYVDAFLRLSKLTLDKKTNPHRQADKLIEVFNEKIENNN